MQDTRAQLTPAGGTKSSNPFRSSEESAAGGGEWRQAHAVRTVQLAMPQLGRTEGELLKRYGDTAQMESARLAIVRRKGPTLHRH